MADFIGTGRSNYFRVKDEKKFLEWLKTWRGVGEVWHDRKDGRVGFSGDEEHGGLPSVYMDEKGNEREDVDFLQELSEHLKEDQVCIYICAGAEKLRYVDGWATAINHKGERREVSTYDIYDLATQLTKKPNELTEASY